MHLLITVRQPCVKWLNLAKLCLNPDKQISQGLRPSAGLRPHPLSPAAHPSSPMQYNCPHCHQAMPSGPVRPQAAPGQARRLGGRAIPRCPACGGLLATHLHGSEQLLLVAAIAVMGLWASGWLSSSQLWWLLSGFGLLLCAVLLYQRLFLTHWPRYKRHEE